MCLSPSLNEDKISVRAKARYSLIKFITPALRLGLLTHKYQWALAKNKFT
jgi:hypothetical protein